jgi:P4 family phage/plasmid primase-like protien
MNIPGNLSSQFKDLSEFLAKHSAKNEQKVGETSCSTHTRIPDKDKNIYAGAFVIPKEELEVFYSLYYDNIFVKNRKEYLTEKQLSAGGPMAVDFDFRYNHDVSTRQHTTEHISDMICEYSECLKECYSITSDKPFDIFIFEKPNVNRLVDGSLTKDGIHMIIGLQIDHVMQMIIREKMLAKLVDIWDMPLINTWDSVLDEGISKGTTNWQLFGSRKPGNEAYELTHHYTMTLDPLDNQFIMDEYDVHKFDFKNKFKVLSVQYDNHPVFQINPKIIDLYNTRIDNKGSKIKKASSKIKMNHLATNDDNSDENDNYMSINDIIDKETLDKAVNIMLSKFNTNEQDLLETHLFCQALPEKYYNPGSHLLNRSVAFALKHTDDRLFLSWIQLRSKATDFEYNTISELYSTWSKFGKSNYTGHQVTKKSIMYWVRKDNFEEYEKIKSGTTDYFIDRYVESATEYDGALLLRHIYKDKYVCVSYDKKGSWYQFKNHNWRLDKGLSLRTKISQEVYNLVTKKEEELERALFEYTAGGDDVRVAAVQKRIIRVGEIKLKLKRTTDKDHIMREASELFYDDEFIKNMDTNKYLMCFNNGVIDFTNKIFREGYPEDYITKSTKINYVTYDSSNEEFVKIVNEIDIFMTKLFPISDMKRYMYDHFASCLIGANKNQTFHIYHGSGSNGKSIVTDLMAHTLGEYKGTVPITLVTDSRGKIGGTSDEVLKLKGVRYAVMQEPSKNVKLNEGVMKELTGGDPLQVRGLYCESEIFDPQFSLVVCTNNLFDIDSNEDGTWRRIRKCDYLGKFVDEGETYYDDSPYIYPKDKSLKDKLPSFAPTFASILVKRAFETDGIVLDCEMVLNASNKYRRGQDHIAAFVSEMIIKSDNPKDQIKKTGLQAAFKQWFECSQGSRKTPKGEELYEYMNKKFGVNKSTGWMGVKFVEPEEEDEEILATI